MQCSTEAQNRHEENEYANGDQNDIEGGLELSNT